MRTCILALIFCFFIIAGRQAIADDTRTVVIHGSLMSASFGISSEYSGPSLLRADSRWSDRDCYYLRIDGPEGPIYRQISIQRGKNPGRTPTEELASWLNNLRRSYKAPVGSVTKIVKSDSRTFPILRFSGTAGNMALTTIYIQNEYIVNIIFNEDLPSHYPDKRFANLV